MSCAYCGRNITREEMKNETFVWAREFKDGKEKNEKEFSHEGLSKVLHRRCFSISYIEEHPCKRWLVE